MQCCKQLDVSFSYLLQEVASSFVACTAKSSLAIVEAMLLKGHKSSLCYNQWTSPSRSHYRSITLCATRAWCGWCKYYHASTRVRIRVVSLKSVLLEHMFVEKLFYPVLWRPLNRVFRRRSTMGPVRILLPILAVLVSAVRSYISVSMYRAMGVAIYWSMV